MFQMLKSMFFLFYFYHGIFAFYCYIIICISRLCLMAFIFLNMFFLLFT